MQKKCINLNLEARDETRVEERERRMRGEHLNGRERGRRNERREKEREVVDIISKFIQKQTENKR